MKLAFTSCIDTVNDPVQAGWNHLASKAPDAIVLLGDTIYMDYGFGNHQPNGSPRGEPLDRFSQLMHGAYKAQWGVANFRNAIQGRSVYTAWDDHDFAWNNARGAGPTQGKDFVDPAYRRLSRLQFETFRQALAARPADYPPNPAVHGHVELDLGTIAQTVVLAQDVVMHLVDARSFREEEGETSLLGRLQREQLDAALLPEPGVNIIASSSTVKEWKQHDRDHDWLRSMSRTHRILILSGDVHKPDFRARGRLYEATASAMAQPPSITAIVGKRTQVFGVLGIEPDRLHVEIFVASKRVENHVIMRSDWSVQ